jgi:alpha-amylase
MQINKLIQVKIWLPTAPKEAPVKGSAGYDAFDDNDLGSKNQKSTVATLYGTRQQLTRCVAVMRAKGS